MSEDHPCTILDRMEHLHDLFQKNAEESFGDKNQCWRQTTGFEKAKFSKTQEKKLKPPNRQHGAA